MTLFQVLRFWSLIRVLKNYGRFSFNTQNQNKNLLKDKGLKSTILDGKFDIIRISTSNGVLKDFDTQEDFN